MCLAEGVLIGHGELAWDDVELTVKDVGVLFREPVSCAGETKEVRAAVFRGRFVAPGVTATVA